MILSILRILFLFFFPRLRRRSTTDCPPPPPPPSLPCSLPSLSGNSWNSVRRWEYRKIFLRLRFLIFSIYIFFPQKWWYIWKLGRKRGIRKFIIKQRELNITEVYPYCEVKVETVVAFCSPPYSWHFMKLLIISGKNKKSSLCMSHFFDLAKSGDIATFLSLFKQLSFKEAIPVACYQVLYHF